MKGSRALVSHLPDYRRPATPPLFTLSFVKSSGLGIREE